MIFFLREEQAETLARLICAGRFVLGAESGAFDAEKDRLALFFLEKLFRTDRFDERYESTVQKILPALRLFQAQERDE